MLILWLFFFFNVLFVCELTVGSRKGMTMVTLIYIMDILHWIKGKSNTDQLSDLYFSSLFACCWCFIFLFSVTPPPPNCSLYFLFLFVCLFHGKHSLLRGSHSPHHTSQQTFPSFEWPGNADLFFKQAFSKHVLQHAQEIRQTDRILFKIVSFILYRI